MSTKFSKPPVLVSGRDELASVGLFQISVIDFWSNKCGNVEIHCVLDE